MQHPQWLPWIPLATPVHTEVHKDCTTSSVTGTTFPGLPTPLGQCGARFHHLGSCSGEAKYVQDTWLSIWPRSSRLHRPQVWSWRFLLPAKRPQTDLVTSLTKGSGEDRWHVSGCSFAAPVTCFPLLPEHISPEYFQRAEQALPPPWSLPWLASSNCSLPGHSRTEFPSSSLLFCAPTCTWPYILLLKCRWQGSREGICPTVLPTPVSGSLAATPYCSTLLFHWMSWRTIDTTSPIDLSWIHTHLCFLPCCLYGSISSPLLG